MDTTFQFVTVYPEITADFDFVSQSCSSQIQFNDSSVVAPVSWLWHFGDGDSATVKNPVHSYTAIGIYDVELIATSNNGCKDTTTVQLDFNSPPVGISANATICKNNSTQLNASGGVAYAWTPATGLDNPSIANPIADPLITTTYTVSIASVNSIGDTCIRSLTTTIKVKDPLLYTISATTDKDTLFQGESTTIHAVTDTSLYVTWLTSTGVILPHDFDPTVSPEQTTTYTVIVSGDLGCDVSSIVSIEVISKECDPASVFIPNTFTPNGDGKNDVLFVRGKNITDLYFAVYNRWGQMVFETTDIKKGWNGIYKEMRSDPVVFAWYVRAKCLNGEEIKKQGNVTLIR